MSLKYITKAEIEAKGGEIAGAELAATKMKLKKKEVIQMRLTTILKLANEHCTSMGEIMVLQHAQIFLS